MYKGKETEGCPYHAYSCDDQEGTGKGGISEPKYVATVEKRKVYYSHVRMTYDEAQQECGKISATLVGDEEGVDALVSFASLTCQKHSVVLNINSILDKRRRWRNVLEYAK